MLGFPTGGETISVTKGVVSRVEVVHYVHAAASLLGIQIDAAINHGKCFIFVCIRIFLQ